MPQPYFKNMMETRNYSTIYRQGAGVPYQQLILSRGESPSCQFDSVPAILILKRIAGFERPTGAQ
ncbi:MAG TPA: hypothetical protein V6C78_28215, partial [Crinalium sp.]